MTISTTCAIRAKVSIHAKVLLVNTCQGRYTECVTMKPQESGRIGGIRRMATLTPRERVELARAAAQARWKRVPKAERSEAARKAVLARWGRAKDRKSKPAS